MHTARQQVLHSLSTRLIDRTWSRPLRVAIDGRTASGKTTLSKELRTLLEDIGQKVYLAAIDDFHNPREIRYRQGKMSGKGYYEDARDLAMCRSLLLDPLAPGGSRQVALKGFDLINDRPYTPEFIQIPDDAIVLVEGSFLQRPEFAGCWDVVIYVQVSESLSIARGSQRDARDNPDKLEELVHRYTHRYARGFEHYCTHVSPETHADFIWDNTHLEQPVLAQRTPVYRVASVQMENSTDQANNLNVMTNMLALAASQKADIVMFPECALTGFHSKPEPCTPQDLEPLIARLHRYAMAHQISVLLPSIIHEDDAFFNGGWFLDTRGQRTRFVKRGLTESEQKFFTVPDDAMQRVFAHENLRLGVLLCREVADSPETYFDARNVDLVLWPTYWRWDDELQWGSSQEGELAQAAYEAVKHWGVPLCQSNYSANSTEDVRASGPSGQSVIINANNTHLMNGETGKPGILHITLHAHTAKILSTTWHPLNT